MMMHWWWQAAVRGHEEAKRVEVRGFFRGFFAASFETVFESQPELLC